MRICSGGFEVCRSPRQRCRVPIVMMNVYGCEAMDVDGYGSMIMVVAWIGQRTTPEAVVMALADR